MEKNWNLPGTFHLQSDLIDFYVYFRYNTDEITNHEGKQSMNQKELSELRRRWRWIKTQSAGSMAVLLTAQKRSWLT